MRTSSRRSFALLALCAAALGVVGDVGCSKKAASGKPKLTFALDWVPEPEFGGFYAAKARGDFDSAAAANAMLKRNYRAPFVVPQLDLA
jgi:ABC-type nitrate/sulfonate/bicarbonate transport system substrate-binding protein